MGIGADADPADPVVRDLPYFTAEFNRLKDDNSLNPQIKMAMSMFAGQCELLSTVNLDEIGEDERSMLRNLSAMISQYNFSGDFGDIGNIIHQFIEWLASL